MSVNFKKTVNGARKSGEGFLGEDKDEHPSYGMVSISNIVHSGEGKALFGSGINHNHYISLEIHNAERNRDAYSDFYFSRNRIIEINLSAAQFVGLMTKSNTCGVPCTINWDKEHGSIDAPPEHNIKTEMMDDLNAKYKDLASRVASLSTDIKESLKGPILVKDKICIQQTVDKIQQDLGSNLGFLQKCQTKKLEGIGSEIVAEAEASINGMINTLGLEALGNQIKKIGFSGKGVPDGKTKS